MATRKLRSIFPSCTNIFEIAHHYKDCLYTICSRDLGFFFFYKFFKRKNVYTIATTLRSLLGERSDSIKNRITIKTIVGRHSQCSETIRHFHPAAFSNDTSAAVMLSLETCYIFLTGNVTTRKYVPLKPR
jgi:hypothetical protein